LELLVKPNEENEVVVVVQNDKKSKREME